MVADSTKRRLTLRKILYYPLTWAAVGAHVLLLVVPFDSSPSEAAEDTSEQPKELESIPVDILNLSEIATSEPPPSAPLAAPPPVAPAGAIASQPVPSPADISTSVVDPGPATEVQAETVATVDTASTQQQEEQQSAYDPSGDQRQFIQNLEGLGLGGFEVNGERSLPNVKSFRNGTDPSYFIIETGVRPNTVINPAAGAREARWLDKEPGNVLGELTATYAAAGIGFTPIESYGAEPLYELTTANGDPFMYISLVQLKGSTLLVVWQADPRIQ